MDDVYRGFTSGGWLRASKIVDHETSCLVLGAEIWGTFERLPSYTVFWQMSDLLGNRGYLFLVFCAKEVSI